MQEFLSRVNITGFDAETYINNHKSNVSALPNIAVAFSGGGYRALLNGAGMLAALDSRVQHTTEKGQLGGVLQASTYVAGLSGGGWLVGSVFVNNFSSVEALRDDTSGSVWEFGNSILEGPDTGGIQLLDSAEYYHELEDSVSNKNDAGFNTTLTDYWGRGLSFQLVNATNGGPSYTWSSLALDANFVNGDSPMPILMSNGRAPGERIIPTNNTVYEFSPFEFGSFDPTTYGMLPIEYVGTNFTAGSVAEGDRCVRGFDNAGYVMGTSSSLFNQIVFYVNDTSIPNFLKGVLTDSLNSLGDSNNDIAEWYPNPFYRWNEQTSAVANSKSLTLVDGGEAGQNIPLHPLIQPDRHVDVVFAFDNSADTPYNYPNGTSLVSEYQRSLSPIANGTSFPAVPDQNTFVNEGLNARPSFFGCDPGNTTHTTPLVVYMPLLPYSFFSNYSTFSFPPSYNDTVRNSIIQNGFDSATLGNGTTDERWPTCVGCAILSRSFNRTGTTVPKVCQQCFSDYCWNGKVNSTTPPPYEPTLRSAATQAAKTNGPKKSAANREYVSPKFAALFCFGLPLMLQFFF